MTSSNIPLWAPRFQVSSVNPFALLYKPFPRYFNWLEAWDLTPLITDIGGNINAAQAAADAAQAAADAAQAAADAAQAAADATQSSVDNFRDKFLTFAFFGDQLHYTQGAPARIISSAFPYCYVTYTTTLGATALMPFIATPGSWEIKILTVKNPGYGKIDVAIDGVGVLINYDLYAAVTDYGYEITLSNVQLYGYDHQVSFSVVGKNASSTGYALVVNKMWGRRTGPNA